ncbi:caspase-3-like [Gigantopelta aegis]|uniref:caspase-3-like n=1 Tax=Gigantopelta aegis TaxID=1735272 RepID=UPI001B8883C3|nr:caspase-3-like [Gigantopelta aegis]XP_041377962.1 caspase-3-like [Gigantopelta aegis]XP_041377963.1 caspase-3-like [Gigantopelta aegis]
MNNEHKEILRRNRSAIIREIHDIKTIVYALEENGVITENMLEDIMAENTPTDKKRELLIILPRRGANAFDQFYEILVNNQEGSAADILKPELSKQRIATEKRNLAVVRRAQACTPLVVTSPTDDDDDDDLPEKWPDENLISETVIVKVCEESGWMYDRFIKSNSDSGKVYKHQSNPRGYALLINNEKFELARKNGCNLEDRDGTDIDQFTVDQLLDQLGYKVCIREDLTAEKMESTVNQFSQFDHSPYDSFVLFVLSHGESQSIYGVDGKLVQKDKIIGTFHGNDCPTLSGKPKLFFFQACQGQKVDLGAPIASVEPVSSSSGSEPDNVELSLKKMKDLNLNKTSAAVSRDDTVADVRKETSVPAGGDVFIASATIPDYLSWRNTKKGTWFIQAIVYIFQKFAHKDDISKLMTKVNRLVGRGRTNDGLMQVSTYESRLSKDFYFFPGLWLSSSETPAPPSNMQPTS